ncbi:VanZ family protein [Flavobacterium agrisoli]|uniref:VanZ family protein n=1 Tax=Flavobacterium agrisoli TaxID=2793066 RepID=A0A934UIX1_9FLAO|nr:VanZ family protein [Flavobacterium agrisoli]MBK0368790.1 VanZ family protein [Flavobacterium agrisoli]
MQTTNSIIKMPQKFITLLLLFVIALVFYFSWLSDPNFSNENYLPRWLLNWSSHYYNLRTAVPFLALGFLLEINSEYKTDKDGHHSTKPNFIQNIGIAGIIVCLAEGGQFLIQSRSPDLADVFYGIIGSVVGALMYHLLKKLRHAKQT